MIKCEHMKERRYCTKQILDWGKDIKNIRKIVLFIFVILVQGIITLS